MRAVPRLCEFYPGICLTTEEKARENLSHISQYIQKLVSISQKNQYLLYYKDHSVEYRVRMIHLIIMNITRNKHIM